MLAKKLLRHPLHRMVRHSTADNSLILRYRQKRGHVRGRKSPSERKRWCILKVRYALHNEILQQKARISSEVDEHVTARTAPLVRRGLATVKRILRLWNEPYRKENEGIEEKLASSQRPFK